jgi:MarR family transcriptional regulator, organic hydroperoxide resistance regulator
VRELQSRLALHGVSFGHWTFLRILWERDGLTQRELSDEAGVMEPSTYAAITAMEKLGYVRRIQVPQNRKNVYVHLTAKGRALRGKLVPLAVAVNKAAVRGVSRDDVAAARRTLMAVIANLSGPRDSRANRHGVGIGAGAASRRARKQAAGRP